MNKFLTLSFIFLLLLSCKSPEARRPVSVKSGTFMEQSIQRNRALYETQKALFETYMNEHSNIDFITSQNGFWYYYNSEKSKDTITVKFGDIVNYDFDIKKINGEVIYSKETLKKRNYTKDQEKHMAIMETIAKLGLIFQ